MRFTILALLASALVMAEDGTGNWEGLRQLRPGDRIEVVDARMKSHRGEFARFDAGAVSLATKSGEVTLKKDEVMRVSAAGQSRRLRKTLLGAAIGGVAGVALSAAFNARFANEGHDGYLYPILAPVGIGVGAAIGATGSSFQTVYRAPKK